MGFRIIFSVLLALVFGTLNTSAQAPATPLKVNPDTAAVVYPNAQQFFSQNGVGDLFVWTCFKDAPTLDTKVYVTTSRDGVNLLPLNNGNAVYDDPHSHNVRDVAPFYDASTQTFYAAYTENFGADNYFPIISSKDLIHWTLVANINTGSNGAATTWNPIWFTDNDGSVHIIVSLSPVNGGNPFWIRLYEMHPTTPGNYSAWSSPVALGMPARTFTDPSSVVHTSSTEGYNEGFVFRSPDDSLYHIVCVDFTQNAKQVHFTASTLTGTYTQSNVIGLDGNEGAFLMRLSASRWRIWVANVTGLPGITGTGTGYGYADLNASFQLITGTFYPVNCSFGQDNGKMIRVPSTALGGSMETVNPVVGTMNQQMADNVNITGGTIMGTKLTSPAIDAAHLIPSNSGTALSVQQSDDALWIHSSNYQAAYGFWRNITNVTAGTSWQFPFQPRNPSATVNRFGWMDVSFGYTSASCRILMGDYYDQVPSGAAIFATNSYPTITASASLTLNDGDVITDGAGASAKALAGTGTTILLRWINGTRWFTTGNTIRVNGTSSAATVSSPGTVASGVQTYLIYYGYDTGGTPGLTWWNGGGGDDSITAEMRY